VRFWAPGRVNLIGSHTDFQDGLVLPLALPLGVEVTVESDGRPQRVVTMRSERFPGVVEVPADGSAGPGGGVTGWGRYVAGVVWALAELGRPPVGMSGSVTATVPDGAGLASSAALEVAAADALCAVAEWDIDRMALALACQRAEVEGAGVPCGIMDQLTAALDERDGALLIDCRSLATEKVPIPSAWSVIVADSGARRQLSRSPFGDRKREVDEGARLLGKRLRDATEDDVAALPQPLRRRCRHVVTENARVLEAVEAIRRADADRLGDVFARSHRSDVEDYEASHPAVDELVAALLTDPHVFAARMTGGGFGGIVVAVTDAPNAFELEAIRRKFRALLPQGQPAGAF
jgi:galactokinase